MCGVSMKVAMHATVYIKYVRKNIDDALSMAYSLCKQFKNKKS